jgi:hypothetical protein
MVEAGTTFTKEETPEEVTVIGWPEMTAKDVLVMLLWFVVEGDPNLSD